MIDQTPHNTGPHNSQPLQQAELGGLPISPAQWLRIQADEENADLKAPANLPSDASERVTFDRDLRSACSRVMGQATCPDAVRQAILSAMHKEVIPAPLTEHDGVIRTRMGDTRSPSFWSGARRYAAIAALIAIAAFVILQRNTFTSGGHVMPVQQASLISSFIEDQHERFAPGSSAPKHELTPYSIEEACKASMRELGVQLVHLGEKLQSMGASGFEFVGLGKCQVPGHGPSVHLMFRVADPNVAPVRVSLFIQTDAENVNIRESACYLTGCPKKKGTLVVWRTDGVVNYLYACTPEALKIAREAMHVPPSEKPL